VALRKPGAFKAFSGDRGRAQPELVVSAIVIVAVLIFILTGTSLAAELERWAGERVKMLLVLVLLNVALIIAGLRRLSDLNRENERRREAVDLTLPDEWISKGHEGEPRLTIRASAKDFIALVKGEKNAQMAVMAGDLELEPMNLDLAMKLGPLFSAS